jgi:hypothetical protein
MTNTIFRNASSNIQYIEIRATTTPEVYGILQMELHLFKILTEDLRMFLQVVVLFFKVMQMRTVGNFSIIIIYPYNLYLFR